MPIEAGAPACVRCGREVRVNRDSYEIFERMHYVCFHYPVDRTRSATPAGVPRSGSTPHRVPYARRHRVRAAVP
jgi:hypothetical protein